MYVSRKQSSVILAPQCPEGQSGPDPMEVGPGHRSIMIDLQHVGILRSFMHNIETATSFLAIPGMQSYAPQSGQIFGILGQIKEDVEENLSEAQKSALR